MARFVDRRSSKAQRSIRRLEKSKLKILLIASLTCLCLFLNLFGAVFLSKSLGDWGRSTEQWLACSAEVFPVRRWEAYDFFSDDVEDRSVAVCSRSSIVEHGIVQTEGGDGTCQSDCFWHPQMHTITGLGTICALEAGKTLEMIYPDWIGKTLDDVDYIDFTALCAQDFEVLGSLAQMAAPATEQAAQGEE